jgi:hypothetical protein
MAAVIDSKLEAASWFQLFIFAVSAFSLASLAPFSLSAFRLSSEFNAAASQDTQELVRPFIVGLNIILVEELRERLGLGFRSRIFGVEDRVVDRLDRKSSQCFDDDWIALQLLLDLPQNVRVCDCRFEIIQ